MRSKFLLILFVVFLIACSLSSPFAVATPAIEILYRSPRDMNLQPKDVPDLLESPVKNPATQPLLPEATDQDQRAYVSQTQSIYIESNVIMLPERTKRQSKDIAEEVVPKRRPNAKIDNNEQPVSVGDSANLITINAFCSSDFSTGFILVVLRNNVVLVLIGCGSDVTRDYIINLGGLVDAHISAPPTQGEIAMGLTQQAATTSPQGFMQEPLQSETVEPAEPTQNPKCSELNLTPEECANYGGHEYQLASCTSSVSGTCPNFSGDRCDTYRNANWSGFDYEYQDMTKTGTNTYTKHTSYVDTMQDGAGTTHKDFQGDTTWTLDVNGFTLKNEQHNKEWGAYNHDCYITVIAVYTLTK